MKNKKITIKKIILFFTSIIILLYILTFYNLYFLNNEIYAKETSIEQEIKISNANKIDEKDIEEKIKANINEPIEEIETKQEEIEYITEYKTNNKLPKGTLQVIQEGRTGMQEVVIKKKYENGNVISEEQLSSKILKSSINKIVEVGSSSTIKKYDPQIGETAYVTSDRLSVMIEPKEDSQKIATLLKTDEITILEKNEYWYYIKSKNATGWVKKESIASNKNYKIQEEVQNNNSNITKNINFDIQLNKPSNLSLEQFKQILTDSKDVNKIFSQNAEYFYYIEKQYNINGVFVAAVAIHESNWGTSNISKQKNNLFGYGAYDNSPYKSAYNFSNVSEGIDLIARVFVKYYLNPKGTSIYSNEKAIGTYYNGPTLSGVNKRYATDKNWANKVYSHMSYLYDKL